MEGRRGGKEGRRQTEGEEEEVRSRRQCLYGQQWWEIERRDEDESRERLDEGKRRRKTCEED